MTLWQNINSFDESSTYLNGWFRDYLWLNSTPLIHGYNTFGANDLSLWAWAFLGAHLCWATGFMFLISWRGYWQEFIDIILYMHFQTPISLVRKCINTTCFIYCSSKVCWSCSFLYWIYFNLSSFYSRCHKLTQPTSVYTAINKASVESLCGFNKASIFIENVRDFLRKTPRRPSNTAVLRLHGPNGRHVDTKIHVRPILVEILEFSFKIDPIFIQILNEISRSRG